MRAEPSLYPEPLRAFRAWRPDRCPDGSVFLRSLVMRNSLWPIGGWLQAVPHSLFGRSHSAPDPLCDCGIWGLTNASVLLRQYGFAIHVLGEAEYRGDVVLHEGGLRSSEARVSAVFAWSRPFIDSRRADRIMRTAQAAARTYDVPLVWLARM